MFSMQPSRACPFSFVFIIGFWIVCVCVSLCGGCLCGCISQPTTFVYVYLKMKVAYFNTVKTHHLLLCSKYSFQNIFTCVRT